MIKELVILWALHVGIADNGILFNKICELYPNSNYVTYSQIGARIEFYFSDWFLKGGIKINSINRTLTMFDVFENKITIDTGYKFKDGIAVGLRHEINLVNTGLLEQNTDFMDDGGTMVYLEASGKI